MQYSLKRIYESGPFSGKQNGCFLEYPKPNISMCHLAIMLV